jgi:hypothetical protein
MEEFIQITEQPADFDNAPYSVKGKASPAVVQGTTALPASQVSACRLRTRTITMAAVYCMVQQLSAQ